MLICTRHDKPKWKALITSTNVIHTQTKKRGELGNVKNIVTPIINNYL